MRSLFYLTLCAITCLATNNLSAQDCPPINYMKNGSCIIVEFATVQEANEAYNIPVETLVVTNSPGNDGVYIAQMMADEKSVIFSQGEVCGYENFEGAVEGTFLFTNSGLECTYGASGTILPVEFTHFEVDKRNNFVQLTWGTATEIENDGFSIERSIDGKNFETLGFVVGEGTSESEINYAFTDRAPKGGKNYYRLKQVDFNGNYAYSVIQVIDLNNATKIKINYDLGSENIIFTTQEPLARVEIYDMSGNKLIELAEEYSIGENRIDVQSLVAGNYVLITTDENGLSKTSRFIKI